MIIPLVLVFVRGGEREREREREREKMPGLNFQKETLHKYN